MLDTEYVGHVKTPVRVSKRVAMKMCDEDDDISSNPEFDEYEDITVTRAGSIDDDVFQQVFPGLSQGI